LCLANIRTNSTGLISGNPSLTHSTFVISSSDSLVTLTTRIMQMRVTCSPFFNPWHFSTACNSSPTFKFDQPRRRVTVLVLLRTCSVVIEKDMFLGMGHRLEYGSQVNRFL